MPGSSQVRRSIASASAVLLVLTLAVMAPTASANPASGTPSRNYGRTSVRDRRPPQRFLQRARFGLSNTVIRLGRGLRDKLVWGARAGSVATMAANRRDGDRIRAGSRRVRDRLASVRDMFASREFSIRTFGRAAFGSAESWATTHRDVSLDETRRGEDYAIAEARAQSDSARGYQWRRAAVLTRRGRRQADRRAAAARGVDAIELQFARGSRDEMTVMDTARSELERQEDGQLIGTDARSRAARRAANAATTQRVIHRWSSKRASDRARLALDAILAGNLSLMESLTQTDSPEYTERILNATGPLRGGMASEERWDNWGR